MADMKKCANWKCKKEYLSTDKKCPHCGWENKIGKSTPKPEPTITLTVSRPQIEADGSFTIYAYAIVRNADGSLVASGQKVFFHTDDLDEVVEETDDVQLGRVDNSFHIPASQAGESVAITAHTQINNKRYEATKSIPLPRKKVEPPGEEPSIALTVSSPKQEADGSFTVNAYAIVYDEKGILIGNGHEIFFHSDDLMEINSQAVNGKAGKDLKIAASRAGKNVEITAYTAVGNKRYEVIKLVSLPSKKETTPEPNELEIRPHGENGKYEISIQVLEPCKKTSLVIYDDSSLKPILPGGHKKLEIPTDDKGYYSLVLLPFKEKQREIHIEIMGSGANRKIPLYGPKSPKPAGKFKPLDGFMANFLQKPTLRRT